MKILFLTKYDNMGASSRYRFFQFYDFYEKNGINSTTKPLFSDDYLIDLYNGRRDIKAILKAYIKRFFILFSVKKYDLLVIEKELFPYFPATFEFFFRLLKIKYIVDYDDALFHQYDDSKSKLVKFFLSNKIAKVMKYSDLVVVGNDYLASYAKNKTKAKVVVIPTVIDIEKYDKAIANKKDNNKIIIGWIGSPSTSKYLTFLEDVFVKLSEKYNIKVHIIGSSISPFKIFEANLIRWSQENEIKEMKNFDIGIMPLNDSPWERGKCGFKLIQYMGCSMPVVGSPVGVNSEIIDNEMNGYLALTQDDWYRALEILIQNRELRVNYGENGREKVIKKYSKKSVENHLISLYFSVKKI